MLHKEKQATGLGMARTAITVKRLIPFQHRQIRHVFTNQYTNAPPVSPSYPVQRIEHQIQSLSNHTLLKPENAVFSTMIKLHQVLFHMTAKNLCRELLFMLPWIENLEKVSDVASSLIIAIRFKGF
ncbi:hypothetical protein [Ascidiaceihabitans sp.]|uniref:hypothetical protein n=1 Tax=Ascidiaceihabitans sp. TaxID=1872644 RepID=UPI00329A4374